jgi:hypothetical protein
MGLVSVKNFISPFRSKAQIVTLIVGAILVIVVRFVSSRSDHVREVPSGHVTDASARKAVQMEVKAFLDAQDGRNMPGDSVGNRRSDPSAEESSDEMLALRPSETDRGEQDGSQGSPKRFSDIRKSLGLE